MISTTARSRRHRVMLGTAITVGVVMTSCTSSDGDNASMTAMAGEVSRGDSFAVTYFNVDRYGTGAGVEYSGDNAEDLSSVFIDGRAEATVGEPFATAFRLQRLDALPVDFADVDAMYATVSGGGAASLLVGEFDPDEVDERTEQMATSGEIDQRLADRPRDVTDEYYLQLADGFDGGIDDVLGVDSSQTALGVDGAEEVMVALDDAGVYAAAVLLDGTGDDVSFDEEVSLATGWDVAGFASGFSDGEQQATMALWHATDEDAEANGDVVGDVMADYANCVPGADVDVQLDGPLMTASCPSEQAGWVAQLLARSPAVPGIFGSITGS